MKNTILGKNCLTGAEFQTPLLWFACYQNLTLHKPSHRLFCTNNICLRHSFFKIKTLLCLANAVSDRSKASLLNPYRGANLLLVALKPRMLPKCHHWWKQQLLAEERKHNAKLLTVKKGSEVLQYLMSCILTYTRRLEKWKIDVITSKTALCCLKY